MIKRGIAAALVGIVALGSWAFAQSQRAAGGEEEDDPGAERVVEGPDSIDQPIAFPHDIHAGEYRIDCQYCHYSAERSVDAGMPPVATCMGCHQIIPGSENPEEVQRLREYWSEREAIPWVRVYKVSDHVRFPHMRHVTAGVDCATCHGEVEEMGVVEEVNQPLDMGWCVSCHVERGASTDCTSCHY